VTKSQILSIITGCGLVPVVRAASAAQALQAIQAIQ